MTDKEIEDIWRRWSRTTPGPWRRIAGKYRISGPPDDPGCIWKKENQTIARVRAKQEYRDEKVDEANAEFIEHSWEDIRNLLIEVKNLKSKISGNS